MRVQASSGNMQVNAVSGTYVVTFGIHLPEKECQQLRGFSIHREDHTDNEKGYLKGMKRFEETDPGFPKGSSYSTKDHPVQDFLWADYTAKPGHKYTYTISARKGDLEDMEFYQSVEISIKTESPASKYHEVYFNRGIAASQEYVRRFGDARPGKKALPDDPKLVWLSRGIYEAITTFIATCEPGVHSLRIAAYEFVYEPFLKLLKQRIDDGVDIQIVYDYRKSDGPKEKNEALVNAIGLTDYCYQRTQGASYISHNKFIVKLENGKPIQVLTGGTNFSISGIFGHSNVAHIVKDKTVAKSFLKYWDLLAQDLPMADSKNENETISPMPDLQSIPKGTTALFSPRNNLDLLELYRDLAMQSKDGFFMTFAFGINPLFKDVYRNNTAGLRFSLMEKKTRPFKKTEAEAKKKEEEEIQELRNMAENIFAIGNFIPTNDLDNWVIEQLSRLSKNVQYIHNKFMLVDPLSDDPLIVAGSANFSDASTRENDENMLLIRGNTEVADIYLGEFMRLWKHHAFRESLGFPKNKQFNSFLRTDDWWAEYFQDNDKSARRVYFAQLKD